MLQATPIVGDKAKLSLLIVDCRHGHLRTRPRTGLDEGEGADVEGWPRARPREAGPRRGPALDARPLRSPCKALWQ